MNSKEKGLVSLGVMAGISAVLIFGSDSAYNVLSSIGKASYVPGTYVAGAQGFGGEVKISVTIAEDGSIADVSVLDMSTETDGIGQAAAPQLAEAMTAAQGPDVEAVAGASLTSGAMKEAMEAALAKAANGETASEEEIAAATATEAATEAAAEEGQQTAAAGSASYAPGTYEAGAQGFGGEVKVKVTIADDGSIGNIEVVDMSTETDGIGQAAAPQLAEAMVAAQSTDVDGVAGASLTSGAMKEAVGAALAEAAGGADAAAADGAASGSYTPGTYEAGAQGFGGEVKVKVTIADDGSIGNIEVVDMSTETDGIGQAAAPQLAEAMVAAQSADVDGVAGASLTSGAMKEAVGAALAQAAGGADAAAEETTEAAAPAETPAGEYVTGTYEATELGFGGDVTVAVTIAENGGIEKIEIVDMEKETPEVGQAAAPQLAEAMVAAQSAEVDGVAGATFTSKAVKAAAAKALAQASGDAAAEETAAEETTEAAEEAAAEETTEAAEAETAAAEEAAAAGAYTPGTYEAGAQGFGGEVKVAVTIADDGSIGNIEVVDMSTETDGIGQAAAPQLAEAMVAAQSADVDGVAGASMTSGAMKEAVSAALAEAAGGAAEETAEAAEEETTEAAEEAAAEETTEAVEEAAAEETTEAAEAETAAAEEAAAAGAYTPGTYEAGALGFGGEVKVAVTIADDGSIGNIEVVDMSTETDGIGQAAAPQLAEAMVAAQSADVDGVAGASMTSKAMQEAVSAALAQAAGGAAEETAEAAEEETTEAAEEAAAEETTEAAEEAAEAETAAAEEAAAGAYTPGTYEAGALGFGGEVKVAVTIADDGSIGNIEVVDMSTETDGIGQAAAPQLAEAMVAAQSADVDGVAGASMTSKAMQEAVSAALAQAAGGAAEETAEAAEEETTEAAAEETTEAAEAETAAAEEAAAAGAYTPGTYEASAQGFQGEVKVAVTVGDNGKITSVQILDYSTETPEVGQAAAVKLSGAIVKAQSADVDVVSGASLTSTAVIEAVKAALAEAAN